MDNICNLDYSHIEHVFNMILKEREQQQLKWGRQNHSPFIWHTILVEEVGEVSKAMLEAYNWPHNTFYKEQGENLTMLKEELIQTLAVGVAMYQSLERNEENSWPLEKE